MAPGGTGFHRDISVAGALLHGIRTPLGWWEAQDEDDLEEVIAKGFRKGCRFADHKERVIALLTRVATVSVETVRIVDALRNGPR